MDYLVSQYRESPAALKGKLFDYVGPAPDSLASQFDRPEDIQYVIQNAPRRFPSKRRSDGT